MIHFCATRSDLDLIMQLAARASALAAKHGAQYSMIDASMDIESCHCNGTPLRLRDLLAAPDSEFAHDAFGIRRHIERRTGVLMDCFTPRYNALTQSAAA